jgi:antitoxin (DNA-binding transcriptional repressor) of toxin-antitoxin stability system
MTSMEIAELKALLSETLARVKTGEEIAVTEEDRPIARLTPWAAASPAAATQEPAWLGIVQVPEKRLDESFWQLPRAEYLKPRREEELEELDWEWREAV